MKSWFSKIIQNAALRGRRTRQQRATPWSRWFPDAPTVEPSRFQDGDDPYPGHWRIPPVQWGTDPEWDPQSYKRLRGALWELPVTWRAVVVTRDVQGRSADQAADELGISPEDQVPLLHRARAALRKTLAEEAKRVNRDSDGSEGSL